MAQIRFVYDKLLPVVFKFWTYETRINQRKYKTFYSINVKGLFRLDFGRIVAAQLQGLHVRHCGRFQKGIFGFFENIESTVYFLGEKLLQFQGLRIRIIQNTATRFSD